MSKSRKRTLQADLGDRDVHRPIELASRFHEFVNVYLDRSRIGNVCHRCHDVAKTQVDFRRFPRIVKESILP
jgi:hypothetical protein